MQIFRNSHLNGLAQDLSIYESKINILRTQSIVYFVGITGSGKSLLINHMLGYPLKVEKNHGVKQLVLQQNEGDNTAKIGTDLATSCTISPQLYSVKEYGNLMLCDTAGYDDVGPVGHNCQLLNQMYLTMAQEIAAIVFVININDLRSGRGGGFSTVFQELKRISNFNEIKNKMQFIINYKNVEQDEIYDIFDQIRQFQKEAHDSITFSPQTDSKIQFFEAIFGKNSPKENANFDNFKERVMIATKFELLNPKSNLRDTFFKRVLNLRGKQTLHLHPSKSRIQLTKHIIRGILSRQSSLQKCIAKYDLYYKSKVIYVNFWSKTEKPGQGSIMTRTKKLSDILLSTDIDVSLTNQLIFKLSAQIQQFEFLGKKLFRSLEFEASNDYFQSHKDINININLYYEIKNIVKQIQGFKVEQEKINLKMGKYDARFSATENFATRKLKVMSIASYQDRDKDMIDFLKSQRMRFQKKLQSKGLLQSLPFKDELQVLVEIVKKNQDQKSFCEFVEKYSLQNDDMFRSLPSREDLKLYENELLIYRLIVSNVDVNKECIDLVFLDKLKNNKFLNFQDKSGYCCLNYHLINKLIRLECGHQYQQYCWNRRFDKKDNQTVINCVVCNKKAIEVQVSEIQKQNYEDRFRRFFELETLNTYY